jgi:hypothetical protein
MRQARKKKQFFSEKKNQKTFARLKQHQSRKVITASNRQKFFVSFFQKRNTFSLPLCYTC